MNNHQYTLRKASWSDDEPALRAIRQTVFIDEQRVPPELEWDDLDADCIHALALDDEATAIGCGRLLSTGQIGRMAVLKDWRGSGVGSGLLRFLIGLARDRGHDQCRLDAQVNAINFYTRHGFIAEGGEFLDANIPHRHMRLTL